MARKISEEDRVARAIEKAGPPCGHMHKPCKFCFYHYQQMAKAAIRAIKKIGGTE